jgi:hypothetical protein
MLNTDGFWAILFSIPLPLALTFVAAAQKPARIAAPAAAAEAKAEIAARACIRAQDIVAKPCAVGGHNAAQTTSRAELLTLSAPSAQAAKVTTSASPERAAKHACASRHCAPARLIASPKSSEDRYVFPHCRLEEFTAFDSQAPPHRIQPIEPASSHRCARSSLSGPKSSIQHSIGALYANAAHLTLLPREISFDAMRSTLGQVAAPVLSHWKNSRRPQRFRADIGPLVLT